MLSADGGKLYVNNEAASTLTVFDTKTMLAEAVIPGFAQPRQGVKLSPDAQDRVRDELPRRQDHVGRHRHEQDHRRDRRVDKLRAISITKDGKTLFAANSGRNTVGVVDVAARKVTSEVTVGKDPTAPR